MAMLPEQFYKTKVLSCPSRREVELPWPRDHDSIRVEKTLFEWRLYHARNKYICCSSEWEARYLKVWLEAGVMRIEIPTDDAILQKVTVELESLARKISEVAEVRLTGYRESVKREVLEGVWHIEEPAPR